MKSRLASLSVALSLSLGAAVPLLSPSVAHAAHEVSGISLEDSTKVGGKELVLSGSGTRIKAGLFKVYVMGLYLSDKKTTAADVLAAQGPKRFKLVMLRELTGEEFGNIFLAAINKNLDKDEKSKLVNQLVKLGEVFETVGGLKKGDVKLGDWVPGTGGSISLNGKVVLPAQPEPLFYNALLRIWFGDKPADEFLKAELLGKPIPKGMQDPS